MRGRTGVKVVARGLLWSLVDVSLADPADLADGGRPLDPPLAPLMGADPSWTPAREDQAPGNCSICGPGVAEGHPFICLGCRPGVSPSNARRIAFARPRRPRPRPVPRGTNRLTKKERLTLLRTAEGPPCLALIDARDAGRADQSSRIERAFALYQSGDLTLAELHDRAGTEPGADPKARRRAAPGGTRR
jgi:hypothetical protein